MKKAQRTRGRKPNPRGKILSNGLYQYQWERILKDAQKQDIEGAVLLRTIIDWYYTAKEQQDERNKGITQKEFKKLPKQKQGV